MDTSALGDLPNSINGARQVAVEMQIQSATGHSAFYRDFELALFKQTKTKDWTAFPKAQGSRIIRDKRATPGFRTKMNTPRGVEKAAKSLSDPLKHR